MSNKVTYTKAIKNGKLKATEVGVGETFSGTLTGFKEGKYGATMLLNIAGREVEVFPSGNLKFVEKDVAEGKRNIGDHLTVTRLENGMTAKGFAVSKFDIVTTEAQQTNPTNNVVNSNTTSLKDRINAVRGKASN